MAAQHQVYQDATGFLPNNPCLPNSEPLNFDRLNYEEERIKSFTSWPVHYPVDPCRLAKAGFYYTGIGDEVVCFSCHGRIKNWNFGDIVLKRHSDQFPHCDFIKGLSNNVPFLRTSNKSTAQPLTIENINDTKKDCFNFDTAHYDKMRFESERLKTFIGKWPLPYLSAADVAHAGFFYTGVGDKVQCAFCRGVKENWLVGSVPLQEHMKSFPWCDFLSRYITPKGKKGPFWFKSTSYDVCGNMKETDLRPTFENGQLTGNNGNGQLTDNDNQQLSNLEDLGVHLHKDPVHPQQASLMARLRSFASWPSDSPVSKEDLATAGFFYIDINDRTICFHCNGGLCSWEEGDDPWVEHARWFPTCDFLRLNKGIDFIQSCLLKSPVGVLNEEESAELPTFSPTEPLLKKVDMAMKSYLVKNVLETGLFPSYIVRAAVLLQIKETGDTFKNIDDLCVAASHLKEKMETDPFDMKLDQAQDSNICPSISENGVPSEVSSVVKKVCPSSSNHANSSDEKIVQNGSTEKSNSLDDDDSKDVGLCKICMDKEVGVVFLPCGHLPACTICAPALKHCPMCRKPIQATVRCYLN